MYEWDGYWNVNAEAYMFSRHFDADRGGAYADELGMTRWSKETLSSIAEGH